MDVMEFESFDLFDTIAIELFLFIKWLFQNTLNIISIKMCLRPYLFLNLVFYEAMFSKIFFSISSFFVASH